MYKIVSTLLLGVSLLSAEILKITPKEEKKLGIQTQSLEKVKQITLGSFNAQVLQSQKETLYVSAKLQGVVKEIYTHKYADVKQGEKLLRLQSAQLLNLQKEYIAANIEHAAAKQRYERDLKLEQKGVIAKKRVLESKRLFDTAKSAEEISTEELVAYGVSKADLEKVVKTKKPTLFQDIYAPKSGQVFSIDVSVGESVGAEKNLLGIYAKGGKYMQIALPLSVVKSLSVADLCLFGDEEARVVAISEFVEERSQSVMVHAALKNPNASRIGQIHQVKIVKEVERGWSVLKSAVVFMKNQAYVFKKVSDGYEAIAVEIVNEMPKYYVVDSAALQSGEKIATTATVALLSAMEEGDE